MAVVSGLRACVELPPEEVEALLPQSDDVQLSAEKMEEVMKSVQGLTRLTF